VVVPVTFRESVLTVVVVDERREDSVEVADTPNRVVVVSVDLESVS
jgi:hypothetical protein